MSQNPSSAVDVIGIDIGKNSFHVVGLDRRGAIVLRQKWSRGHANQGARCRTIRQFWPLGRLVAVEWDKITDLLPMPQTLYAAAYAFPVK